MSNFKIQYATPHGPGERATFYDIEEFTFPDGQPHIKMAVYKWTPVTIYARIKSPTDLFKLGMIVDVLKFNLCGDMHLKIAYLMGARMDRRIDNTSPFTLKVVCDYINSLDFASIELFDVHSYVSEAILNATNILPTQFVSTILSQYTNDDIVVIAPDAGAQHRTEKLAKGYDVVQCLKNRDSNTGALSGFTVCNPSAIVDKDCLIVDDICDGGGTFVGLAKELKACGARRVLLYVSHGIFSKGEKLEGITEIFTTNSYKATSEYKDVTVLEFFED